MNDRDFDNIARSFAACAKSGITRRALLRLLGVGVGAISADVISRRTGSGVDAQEATPSPIGQSSPARAPRASAGPTLEDKAWALEFDLDKIFTFVRDEVLYDSYSGVLRGAKGTLWGLAGNAVDQAILLASLLNLANFETRFVVGALDDSTSAKLLSAAAIDKATAEAVGKFIRIAPADSKSVYPSSKPIDTSLFRTSDTVMKQIATTADSQISDSLKYIQSSLLDAGVSLHESAPQLPERERRQHIWLQYADGSTWIDLDPSIQDAEPGRAYAMNPTVLTELPPEMFHGVTIRVVAEVVTGEKRNRTELLSYQANSRDLVGVPVTVSQPNPSWINVGGAIDGTQRYRPTLVVGETVTAGHDFTVSAQGGVISAFGVEASVDGQALAGWIEIELASPDAPKRRISRTIFDRISFADRTAGTIDLTKIASVPLTQVEGVGKVFLPMTATTNIALVGHAIPWGYFDQDFSVNDYAADLALCNYGYHYVRDVLLAQTNIQNSNRFYLDEPNVTLFTTKVTDIQSNERKVSAEIDIVHRHFARSPLSSSGSLASAASPLLMAGVVSHVAERVMVEGGVQTLVNPPQATFTSVGRVFEAAAQSNIALRTIISNDAIPKLSISNSAQASIRTAIAAGNIAIVPERMVDVNGTPMIGWWLIDPQSGLAIDQLDSGKGNEFAEAVELLHIMFLAASCYVGLTSGIAAVISGFVYGDFSKIGSGYNHSHDSAAAVAGSVAAFACLASYGVGAFA